MLCGGGGGPGGSGGRVRPDLGNAEACMGGSWRPDPG